MRRPRRWSPPRLTNEVTPVYPESKKSSAESARVVLTLTLDANGAVTDVTVATSGGAEFDAAAVAAARELTFAPAVRGGKPIAGEDPFHLRVAYEKPAPAIASYGRDRPW